MLSNNKDKPDCPVGETDCELIEELLTLRRRAAELSDLVHTDTLTGLFNYRHFRHALEQELERTRRSGQPTSLVMVDLDYFKRVNDNWGHEVGNRALCHVADLMVQLFRRVDVPCRYGGEEFAVILPATPLPRAISAAERLRAAVEQTPLLHQGDEISMTVSLGVGVYTRAAHLSPEAFVSLADGYLYQAKQDGRNRVCHPDLASVKPPGQVGREEKDALLGSE